MTWMSALRWALVAPAAVICAWVAYYTASLVAGLSLMMRGVGPPDYTNDWYLQCIGGAAFGAGFVYSGAWVAPTHQKQTAYVLTVVVLMFFGGAVVLAIQAQQYSAIVQAVSGALAAAALTYAISESGGI